MQKACKGKVMMLFAHLLPVGDQYLSDWTSSHVCVSKQCQSYLTAYNNTI